MLLSMTTRGTCVALIASANALPASTVFLRTEKMLIQHLKQLEADNLLIRESRPVVPPYVTYRLTKAGEGLLPVIHAMAEWSFKDKEGAFNVE